MPSLHQDIIPRVLVFIQDDRPTVLACSLVSHTWLPYAREYIFRLLSVKSPDAWRTLVRILSTNPLLRPHVRRLNFTCNLPIQELDVSRVGLLCPQLEYMSLNGPLAQLHLVHCFPHIHTLAITPSRGVQRSPIREPPLVYLRRLRIIASDAIVRMILDWVDETPTRYANTLLEASFSVGVYAASDRVPHYERMSLFLGRHDGLQSLNLSCAANRTTATQPLQLIAPRISRLYLSVDADAYGTAQVFALLNHSDLSNLQHLTMQFNSEPWHGHKAILYPWSVMRDTADTINWHLPASLAKRLETVIMALPNIWKIEDSDKLIGLLGEAGSDKVLTIETNGVAWLHVNGSWKSPKSVDWKY